jgi:hypothetical protein
LASKKKLKQGKRKKGRIAAVKYAPAVVARSSRLRPLTLIPVELSARLRVDGEWLMAEWWEIKALRDALAHYDDEDRLADPVWVHERMRRTHSLAQRIVATTGDFE